MSQPIKTNSRRTILKEVDDLRAKIQQDGKRAFDRDDPIAARKEAGLLEQIDHAQALIAELDVLLNSLGVDVPVAKLNHLPWVCPYPFSVAANFGPGLEHLKVRH